MNTISAVAGEFTAPCLKVRRSVWEQDLLFCIPTFCSFDEPLTWGSIAVGAEGEGRQVGILEIGRKEVGDMEMRQMKRDSHRIVGETHT